MERAQVAAGLIGASDTEALSALGRKIESLESQVTALRAGATSGFTSAVDDLRGILETQGDQIAWLAQQSVTFTSEKPSWTTGDTSGTGEYVSLPWDETYDDVWQVKTSSTGLLKLDLSAYLMINNGNPTVWAGTAVRVLDGDGARLTSIAFQSMNSGALLVPAARSTVVACPPNTTVTLRTVRLINAPVAPKTSWHGSQSVTLTVTQIGM